MPRTVRSIEFVVRRRRKTTHYPLPTTHLHSGFTLIEFLVVLGLLVLTVGSTLLFLTSILKGSNKANVTAEAKQNGQNILESLDRKIRNADGVLTPQGTNLQEIALKQPNTKNVLYIGCFAGNVTNGTNGYIAVVETDLGEPSPDTFKSSPITNTDSVAGVDIEGCDKAFDVQGASDGGTSPPLVTIRFTVNQGIQAPSRKDFVANVQLQTTISLRQYNQ